MKAVDEQLLMPSKPSSNPCELCCRDRPSSSANKPPTRFAHFPGLQDDRETAAHLNLAITRLGAGVPLVASDGVGATNGEKGSATVGLLEGESRLAGRREGAVGGSAKGRRGDASSAQQLSRPERHDGSERRGEEEGGRQSGARWAISSRRDGARLSLYLHRALSDFCTLGCYLIYFASTPVLHYSFWSSSWLQRPTSESIRTLKTAEEGEKGCA